MFFLKIKINNMLHILESEDKNDLFHVFLDKIKSNKNIELIESNVFKIENGKNNLLSPYIQK